MQVEECCIPQQCILASICHLPLMGAPSHAPIFNVANNVEITPLQHFLIGIGRRNLKIFWIPFNETTFKRERCNLTKNSGRLSRTKNVKWLSKMLTKCIRFYRARTRATTPPFHVSPLILLTFLSAAMQWQRVSSPPYFSFIFFSN